MAQRRVTAGEFNHFPVRARELAREHDVVIESHGEPTAVLVSWERYRRLVRSDRTPLEVIADPEAADIEFEIPRFGEAPQDVDL